jgi:hypothetical protein
MEDVERLQKASDARARQERRASLRAEGVAATKAWKYLHRACTKSPNREVAYQKEKESPPPLGNYTITLTPTRTRSVWGDAAYQKKERRKEIVGDTTQ